MQLKSTQAASTVKLYPHPQEFRVRAAAGELAGMFAAEMEMLLKKWIIWAQRSKCPAESKINENPATVEIEVIK